MIDISNLSKGKVLAGLYNASKQLGMGLIHFTPEDMTETEGQMLIDNGTTYFDYLKGRVMKVDLSNGAFDPSLYDRDNGEGAAQRVIDNLH